MRKPKPPTPRSVSATLSAADFRARRDGRAEGYEVEWSLDDPPTGVVVDFEPDWGDDSTTAMAAAEALRFTALHQMAAVLRRKGWTVTAEQPGSRLMFLLVKEA